MPTMVPRTAISRPSAPRLRASAALGLHGTQDLLRRNRQIVDSDADCVKDRVRHCWQYWIGTHLAWALGAERTIGGGALQHGDVMRADVAGTRHQILDKVAWAMTRVGIIGLGSFVQRVADTHPGAANKLLFDQSWIQRATELIGAVHAHHGDLAGLLVDLDLDDHAGMGVAGRG